MADPEHKPAPVSGASQEDAESPADASPEADPILDVTLDALRKAARSVEVERHVAQALQRSLLPKLPTVPGVRLAARYRAGSAGTRVGGDWYDAISLRGGKLGIAIGDVVGRGVEAAARMAHLQSALRAYALDASRPATVLERMNGFVLEGEGGGMVTLLYAVLDPEACTLEVASAGHPPALVLDPTGGPSFAESPPGNPLGVASFASYEESVATLDPWSTILLYTDGLVEGPELPLGEGLDGLRRSLDGAPRDPESLCTAVLAAADGRAGLSDDLALLALQLSPPGETLRIAVPARPATLVTLRRALAQWLRLSGANETELYEILVASGEACANAVAHAHPAVSDSPFELRAARSDGGVEITISDTGRWRSSARKRRGRGLELMDELMDDVRIDRGDRGTTVVLKRKLASPAAT
jgi:anti-sigma regulatory factor (Ser/Thr protein kinase)